MLPQDGLHQRQDGGEGGGRHLGGELLALVNDDELDVTHGVVPSWVWGRGGGCPGPGIVDPPWGTCKRKGTIAPHLRRVVIACPRGRQPRSTPGRAAPASAGAPAAAGRLPRPLPACWP